MKKPTLTATTPFGTFNRSTYSPYRFVAVITMKDGSDVRIVGSAGLAGKTSKTLARWSTTARGAVSNAENYPYMRRETFDVHGPFQVDGSN